MCCHGNGCQNQVQVICVTSSDSIDLLHCCTRMQLRFLFSILAASNSGITKIKHYKVAEEHFCNKLRNEEHFK